MDMVDTVWDTTVWGTEDTMDTPMLTTVRDLLMLSLRLMPMPSMESMDMVHTVWDTEDTDTDTPMLIMATTTARGLLMLSPRSSATLVWSEVSTEVPTLVSPLPPLL